jgi:CheY-like chemotaxis protein
VQTATRRRRHELDTLETILVVDDEADIRTVVRGMLTAKGYVVFETSDPQEALRI